jgi:hypothetical protein
MRDRVRAEDLDLPRGRRNTGASLICGPQRAVGPGANQGLEGLEGAWRLRGLDESRNQGLEPDTVPGQTDRQQHATRATRASTSSKRRRDERQKEDRARLDRTHRDEEHVTAHGPRQGRRFDPYKPHEELPGSSARRDREQLLRPRTTLANTTLLRTPHRRLGFGARRSPVVARSWLRVAAEQRANRRNPRFTSIAIVARTLRGNSERARRPRDGCRNAPWYQ